MILAMVQGADQTVACQGESMLTGESTRSMEILDVMEIERSGRPSLWLWAKTCTEPECTCREAVVAVTTEGASAIADLGKHVLETWAVAGGYEALGEALGPSAPCALVDIDSGELGALSGGGRPAHPLFDELATGLPGVVLDELGRIWFRGKGRRVPEGVRRALATCPRWRSGELVPFEDIFVPVRVETIVLDEKRGYTVIDHHCPDPTCECREVLVEFVPWKGNKLAAMRVFPAGHALAEKGDPELLRELWSAYVRRYPRFALRLKSRTDVMREFGRDYLEWEQRRSTPSVARNAPCPCGSGKKYKKCCWLAEASPA